MSMRTFRRWRRMAVWALIAALVPAHALCGELSLSAMVEGTPIRVDCVSAMLVEPQSGQIIFEKNADEKRAVASVTKIMSILLVLEALDEGRIALTDSVVVSANAAGMGGSQVLLDAGEVQSVEVLLKSTIVGSANDAIVALAEHICGSVQLFVDRMNERARELSMNDTLFVNCTGLPAPGQYTTARDVAKMSMELIQYPLFFTYSTIWLDEVVHESGRETSLTNTNRLVRLYDGCDGLKTGSTNEAGYCVSATAKRGEMRLIAVVLGANTGKERFSIAGDMFDYGYANYRLYPVAARGARIRGSMTVVGGNRDSVPLALDDDLTLLLQKGDEQRITLRANLPESVGAPLSVGDRVGSVDVMMDERVLAQISVVAAESVGRQGLGDGWNRVIEKWFAW